MRKEFQSYLPLSEAKIQEMWSNGLIVLDTNALLDLYRLSAASRNQYINLLKILSSRIWIPHQVGLEFMRKRHDVISKQVSLYTEAAKFTEELKTQIDKHSQAYLNFRIHPSLDKRKIKLHLTEPLDALKLQIESLKEAHPDVMANDHILEEVLNLFEGKVGPPFSMEELEKVKRDGKVRYSNKVPPGFEDSNFGDLILWLQTIAKAKNEDVKSVIFVTSDSKSDWWFINHGATVGPHPELREEMHKEASVDFHMYSLERFMMYAQSHIMEELSNATIQEVKDLEDSHKENDRRLAAAEKLKEVLLRNPGIQKNSKLVDDFSAEYEVLKDKIASQMSEIEHSERAFAAATNFDEASVWKIYLSYQKSELEKQMKSLSKLVQYLGKPQPPHNPRGLSAD